MILLLRVIFSPFTVFITSPFSFIISLWNLRIFGNGNWGDYLGFSFNGVNKLFYWTCAETLYKYGRRGISPYVGDGNYELSRWFFYSLPSLYIFRVASNLSVFFTLVSLSLSYFICLRYSTLFLVCLAVFSSLFSPIMYMNFVRQNYNAIGWMSFPLFLFYVYEKNVILSSLFLILSSFGGITQVFVGNIFLFAFVFSSGWYEGLISLLPANVKIITHFFPVLETYIEGKEKRMQGGKNKSSLSKTLEKIFSISQGVGFLGKEKTKYNACH